MIQGMPVLEPWNPARHAVSCGNCAHALVRGTADDPTVRCAEGFGGELSLWRLHRPKNPIGFRSARNCPSFESMDDLT